MPTTQSLNAPVSARALIVGAGFVVLGELMFASMGVGVRLAAQELPNEVIVFFRNLFGLCLVSPWLLRRGLPALTTRIPQLHLLRALAGVTAMYCFFYAIAHMPLADAMLLKLTAPVFMPVVALVWLGEPAGRHVWIAIALGFVGVLLILRPGLEGISPVALVAVLGGLFAALAKVTVRRLSRSEPTALIVFYFALGATLVSSVPLTWAWQTPSTQAWGWLLAIAIFATLGQLCLTKGLSLAPAGRMGAFGFFSVIFGATYGWIFWAESLLWTTIVGSALIVSGGVFASRRSSRDDQPPDLTEAPAPAPLR